MPKLGQVLQRELDDRSFFEVLSPALLEGDVVAVYLATGAPCDSHAGAFSAWPGSEQDVERWYRLDSGAAAGIRVENDVPYGVAIWEP